MLSIQFPPILVPLPWKVLKLLAVPLTGLCSWTVVLAVGWLTVTDAAEEEGLAAAAEGLAAPPPMAVPDPWNA